MIREINKVKFFHFDLSAQAVAKIQRGFEKDIEDVSALIKRGILTLADIETAGAVSDIQLIRYPNLDPQSFRKKLNRFLTEKAKQSDG